MIEFVPLGDAYPGLEFVCRGDLGCGLPVLGEDRERHRTHHERLNAMEAQAQEAGSS